MARRISRSVRQPRFMRDQEFEDEAALLLAEYGREHGAVTAPPIPVDDIVEEHLKIAVELRDLKAEFPEGDVLGAMYFNEKKIVIDQGLVPEDFPSMRGRYHFTLAHELGHWRLHRHLYLHRTGERPLLPNGAPSPDHVLRAGQSDRKEIQANKFAACLLMPREMVKRAWHQQFGSMDPIYLDDLRTRRQEILTAEVLRRGGFKAGDDAEDNMLLDHVSRPLAETFQVSPDAMRIRLMGMNLLQKTKEPSLFD